MSLNRAINIPRAIDTPSTYWFGLARTNCSSAHLIPRHTLSSACCLHLFTFFIRVRHLFQFCLFCCGRLEVSWDWWSLRGIVQQLLLQTWEVLIQVLAPGWAQDQPEGSLPHGGTDEVIKRGADRSTGGWAPLWTQILQCGKSTCPSFRLNLQKRLNLNSHIIVCMEWENILSVAFLSEIIPMCLAILSVSYIINKSRQTIKQNL